MKTNIEDHLNQTCARCEQLRRAHDVITHCCPDRNGFFIAGQTFVAAPDDAIQPDAPEAEPALRPEYEAYLRSEQAKLDRLEVFQEAA